VLNLALPLVISTAFWSLMWFIDRMFLMWYSSDAMSAALPAGMTHWALVCLPVGIASYVNSFVAQYQGAGRQSQIGLIVAQGVRLGWICGPIFLLAVPLAPYFFAGSGDVVRQEIIYFQVLAFGGGALVVTSARSAFYTGRGLTRVVMLVDIAGTLVNVVLDYLLIFGHFGLPEMGIAGAAWATVASHWFTAGVFWLLMRRRQEQEEFGLAAGNRFDAALFGRLIKFGLPSGLPLMIEAIAFSLLTRYVASLGVIEGAATALAFNVNALAFVPMIGLGIAVSTLVGQKLGEGQADLAARATWTAQSLALIYTLSFAALYTCVPGLFMLAHGAFANPAEFEPVRAITVILLRFVAAYCLLDALQIVFVGALKGAGDTRFIFVATTIISLGSVTIGRLGQVYFGWGLFGWWWVITAWISSLALVFLARFLQGHWRTMSVIEPEIVEPEPAQIEEVAA
jgi:MATE family multidrug resistance protein